MLTYFVVQHNLHCVSAPVTDSNFGVLKNARIVASERSCFTWSRSSLLQESDESIKAMQSLRDMQQGQAHMQQQQAQKPEGASPPLLPSSSSPHPNDSRDREAHAATAVERLLNIETYPGGEDQWYTLWWKIKAAMSGSNGDMANLLNAAERGGVRGVEEILEDDEFVDANTESASRPAENVVYWRDFRTSGTTGKTP